MTEGRPVRNTDDGERLRGSAGITAAITGVFACFMGVLFAFGFWSNDSKVTASPPQAQAGADGSVGHAKR
jgi:hypothetical protein